MKKINILVLLFSIVILATGFYFFNEESNKTYNYKREEIKKIEEEAFVVPVKSSNLYKIADKEITEEGTVTEGIILKVESQVDNYLKIKDLDLYIDVNNIEEIVEKENKRYKSYVPLNIEVETKDKTTIYKSKDKSITYNNSDSFKVIYFSNNKYYIEFNDSLHYLLKDDIKIVKEASITSKVATKVPVLNYHFFYDKKTEQCNEIICLEKSIFEDHLKYLKDNNYMTVTVDELNLWLDNSLELPEKSILITVDDGALGTDTHLIELLEKYDLQATLFLITAWWPKENYYSPNLDIQSHGYDIHTYCGPNKGKALCLTEEQLYEDLKKSTELVYNNTSFCYPFYQYNSNVLAALKRLDFKLGFVGGGRAVTKGANKLLLPRYVIYNTTNLNSLKNMLK